MSHARNGLPVDTVFGGDDGAGIGNSCVGQEFRRQIDHGRVVGVLHHGRTDVKFVGPGGEIVQVEQKCQSFFFGESADKFWKGLGGDANCLDDPSALFEFLLCDVQRGGGFGQLPLVVGGVQMNKRSDG